MRRDSLPRFVAFGVGGCIGEKWPARRTQLRQLVVSQYCPKLHSALEATRVAFTQSSRSHHSIVVDPICSLLVGDNSEKHIFRCFWRAKMPQILRKGLPLCVCMVGTVWYSNFDHGPRLIVSLLGLGLVASSVWVVYWMVLYPKHFSPFRHLPTPSVSTGIEI